MSEMENIEKKFKYLLTKELETEEDFFEAIEYLGGLIWRGNHDLAHNLVLGGKDAELAFKEDLMNFQYTIEEVIDKLCKKFNIQHPHNNDVELKNKQKTYWEWYRSMKEIVSSKLQEMCSFNNSKKIISKIITATTNFNFNEEEIFELIERPPTTEMGDLAIPFFKYAKEFKKSPNLIATEIKEQIIKNNKSDLISKVEVVGSYLNFYLNPVTIAKNILNNIIINGVSFAKKPIGFGGKVVIDFSSPNIAKAFHVGHLRSTVIGYALYNIYNYMGYEAIGVNHLGDWGTQFGKMIFAYKEWGDKEIIESGPIVELQKLYVKFHKTLDTLNGEEKEFFENKGREWFKKLEDGDKEATELWKWFVDLSLKEFNRIYEILNVKFDYYTGESFYNDKLDNVINTLNHFNLLIESQGAKVVNLEKYNMPPCIIQKKDGASIYATRDLAACLYRASEFNFEKAIYVTDYAQNLHFKQWFKVIELIEGTEFSNKLKHISFGRVSTKEGAIKTREGNVILLDDLLFKSIEKAKKIIDEKNPELINKEEVASQIGIGSVIFNDLKNNKNRDIVFDWNEMLNFNGETAPYVQYTYVRANTVLNKYNSLGMELNEETRIPYIEFSKIDVKELLLAISDFSDTIERAMIENEPSIITNQIITIAKEFNKVYNRDRIISDDQNKTICMVVLTKAVATTIQVGFNLLNIPLPSKM